MNEHHFLTIVHPKPSIATLLGLRQREDEPLSCFIDLFISEIQEVLDVHPSLVTQTFYDGPLICFF